MFYCGRLFGHKMAAGRRSSHILFTHYSYRTNNFCLMHVYRLLLHVLHNFEHSRPGSPNVLFRWLSRRHLSELQSLYNK
jgi:hypothetical protein